MKIDEKAKNELADYKSHKKTTTVEIAYHWCSTGTREKKLPSTSHEMNEINEHKNTITKKIFTHHKKYGNYILKVAIFFSLFFMWMRHSKKKCIVVFFDDFKADVKKNMKKSQRGKREIGRSG